MKKRLILLITLFFGFFLGLTGKYYYIVNINKSVKWDKPPILINCIGDKIDEQTIIDAIKFWKEADQSNDILFYQYEYSESICQSDNNLITGFIVLKEESNLHDLTLEENVLASTNRKSELFTIKSALIIFRSGTENFPLLLTHELGHAFGYTHKNQPGNIMHPYYDLMGKRFIK